MKGQKVWVVTEESAVDGMHDIDVRVYAERKEAMERWNERVQAWKDCNEDGRWEESLEREGSYESWEDGYYDENHVTIYLDEKEVE